MCSCLCIVRVHYHYHNNNKKMIPSCQQRPREGEDSCMADVIIETVKQMFMASDHRLKSEAGTSMKFVKRVKNRRGQKGWTALAHKMKCSS
ncbi:hypothetical protein PoB_006451700 [Plakobranchus ocellatus]|uniref:Uncharacterized protein n=1 Tax=Plakobranchus ocellatus TaxID=259542 RepID=A0AAV4D1H5_9GAST|nr:hypothetical protein PoB_006451700 [Plakobranchus ocellatus]